MGTSAPPPLAAAYEQQLSAYSEHEQLALVAQILSNKDVQRSLTKEDRRKWEELLQAGTIKTERERANSDFLWFAEKCWKSAGEGGRFIAGYHHKKLADLFQRIADGKCKRAIIALPPRHTKSLFGAVLFPSWFLGKFPHKRVIQASNKVDLAEGFGRKVRDILGSADYQNLFPGVKLKSDNKAAGRWSTLQGGEYYAIGVGGSMTGKGADLLVIDDPHDEQDIMTAGSDTWDKAWDWYVSGPRQRLQPGGSLVVIATRWSKQDLSGRLISSMSKSERSDNWEVIELPAILPSGSPLWPEFWKLDELLATKATLPAAKWNAQYQQDPTAESSAILKRNYWQIWPHAEPPKCDYKIQSWDTAYEKTQRSDYSACTTWGVFFLPNANDEKRPHLFLLDAWKDKIEFPELKKKAVELYHKHRPDTVIIEKKASGTPLMFDLRAAGIPASGFTPNGSGGDKFVRANSISDIFASGFVWSFDPTHCRWADEVITECAEFGAGDHDDYVDTVTQALLRFRQGGFLRLYTDEQDDKPKTPARYAWY